MSIKYTPEEAEERTKIEEKIIAAIKEGDCHFLFLTRKYGKEETEQLVTQYSASDFQFFCDAMLNLLVSVDVSTAMDIIQAYGEIIESQMVEPEHKNVLDSPTIH